MPMASDATRRGRFIAVAQLQQPGAQHAAAAGLVARTKPLMNVPSTSLRQRVDVEALRRQETSARPRGCRRASSSMSMSSKPALRELRDVLVVAERAGHAADPQLHVLS